MKRLNNKKGLSLIILIITIIVVIILAAVVILTLTKNNPIESAKEARFKEDVRTFQDELAMSVSKQYVNAGGHRDEKITTSDFDEIKEYIPSFSKKYKGKFIIDNDELKYTNKLDEKEIIYAQNLNVKEKIKLLPDEYQQVKYIESSGKQWIETGFYQKDDFILTCEAMFTSRISDNPNSLFSNESLDISLYSNGKMGTKPEHPDITIGEWQTFRMGMSKSSPYQKFVACNDEIRNYESSWVDNYQWCIFNHAFKESYNSAARLKEFTLTDFSGNTILMRGIPALDKDNTPCIYDIISKSVFYNSGTGSFGYETEDGTYVAPTNN